MIIFLVERVAVQHSMETDKSPPTGQKSPMVGQKSSMVGQKSPMVRKHNGINKESLSNGDVRRDSLLDTTDSIVQYIIVRSDLGRNQDRAFNTLISHTSSASTAAIHMFYKHEHTKSYLKDEDNMRKKIFQVDSEEELLELDIKLMIQKIDYRMWLKQPENYATCIALRPYPVSEIAEHFKKLKLYKK